MYIGHQTTSNKIIGQVTLSTNDYNKLLENNIKAKDKKFKYSIEVTNTYKGNEYTILTDNESLLKLGEEMNILNRKIKGLETDLNMWRRAVDNLSTLGIGKFLKWKRIRSKHPYRSIAANLGLDMS